VTATDSRRTPSRMVFGSNRECVHDCDYGCVYGSMPGEDSVL
jgi:hypothetical protein